MFQITINEKGGQAKSLDFDKNEITIGRVQGNDVVLPKGNISKRHSRIVLKDGKFIIIDMQSTNGTYVNGKKITTPQVVKSTDKIYIGDFTLQLSSINGAAVAEPPPAASSSARNRSAAKQDEGDIFAGKSGEEDELDLGGGPRGGAPGLIDENFDQEFEGGAEPAPAKPAPAKATPPVAKKAAKAEPEPPPEREDLDLDLGGADGDLAADDSGLDLGEPPPEEPEPPKAAVVPMKSAAATPPAKPTPKGMPTARPAPAPSKLKPVSPPAKTGTGKAREDRDPFAELDEPAKPSPAENVAPMAPVVPMPVQQNVAAPAQGAAVIAASAQPMLDRRGAIQALQMALINELGLRGTALSALGGLRQDAETHARRIAERMRAVGQISAHESLENLAQDAARAATDVEAIADLVSDDAVHEVVINHGEVLVEREGQLGSADRRVDREDEVVDLIRRLALLAGVEDAFARSLFDLRLRDGSRMVAALPPLAFRGPTLSIRKTAREAFTFEALVQHGALSESMMRFLEYCIRYRRGVLLSVGPGVGASATLNALAALIPVDERVVSVEHGVELHPIQTNIVSFDPNGKIGLAELVHHAVAVQPDRALFGVLTGGHAYEVIEAVAGPLEGSMACYPAGSAALALESLAAVELSKKLSELDAAKRLVARAFPIIVQEQRFVDGSRRITQISELHVDGGSVSVEDVFAFEVEGVDENGLITGSFKATGYVPRFLEELHDRGLEVNMAIFQS